MQNLGLRKQKQRARSNFFKELCCIGTDNNSTNTIPRIFLNFLAWMMMYWGFLKYTKLRTRNILRNMIVRYSKKINFSSPITK